MGDIRNGARSYLNILAKACKLSRLPGFRTGVSHILGPDQTNTLFALWDPLCAFVDVLIAADNWYNQIDFSDEGGGTEDVTVA